MSRAKALTAALKKVKELVEAGYPEEVAKRIATGELPMDAESVAKRAQDQGYDLTSRWYHGTNDNFNEFDPEKVGSAYGVDDQGFYFTSSEDEAIKWAENAPNASSPKAMETVLSMENPWLIDAPNGRSPVEYFESGEGVFNRGQNAAVDYGVDSGYDGMVIRGGEEDMAIAFDPSRIRSPNAAFDPEYKGGNIMGGALAGAVGLGALTQSEDADASAAGLAKRGLKLVQEGHNDNLFKLRDTARSDEQVGYMRLNPYDSGSDEPLTVEMVELDRPGQGIGSLLYDAVEEVTGRPIEPSSELTEDGARFWARRDPDDLRDKWEGGVYDWDLYNSWQNVKKSLGLTDGMY